MIPLILMTLLVLMVAICALIGFLRGFRKSVVRTITLCIAVVLAFAVAIPITDILAENITIGGEKLDDILVNAADKVELLSEIMEYSPLFEMAVRVLPFLIISVILLPLLMYLFAFATLFLYNKLLDPLLKMIFKHDEEKESSSVTTGSRFAGLAVGALTGFLAFGIIMTPMFGFLSILPDRASIDEALDTLVEQETITMRTSEIIKGEVAVLDNPVVKMYSSLGAAPIGRAYLKNASKIEYGKTKTDLTAEAGSLFTIVQTAIDGELVKVIAGKGDASDYFRVLSDTEFTAKLISDMNDSNLLRSSVPAITAIMLKNAAGAMGMDTEQMDSYSQMMGDIATLLSKSDIDFEAVIAYQQMYGVSFVEAFDGSDIGIMSEEEYIACLAQIKALKEDIAEVIIRYTPNTDTDSAMNIADRLIYTVTIAVTEKGNSFVENITEDTVREIFMNLAM